MDRIFIIFGALSAFIGVAAGAFGAHGLKPRLSAEMLAVFEVGVRYQMLHALALIAAAGVQSKWLMNWRPPPTNPNTVRPRIQNRRFWPKQ